MSALGRELLRCLAGTNVVPRLISDHPRPEWQVGPFTVVVKERAEIRYAREPVGSAKPHAEDIIEAMRRAAQRLVDRSTDPDDLLPALAAAYKKLGGGTVFLVELRDKLDMTRPQFAWDLMRLQREQRLVHNGRRIDLGIATGHSTFRKSGVVWLETATGGAYYETFRMIPQERTNDQTTAKTNRRAHRRTGATHARADGRER